MIRFPDTGDSQSAMTLQPAMLAARPLPASTTTRPILFVVVDTEEAFDWNAPVSSASTDVRAIRHVGRLQAIWSSHGIRPTYVVDYPVASQPDGVGPLKEIFDSGGCDIGAHLHPWVTPPFGEDVNGPNSFACNLPRALEAAKIRVLAEQIRASFGTTPTIYKAGRYGFGPSTAAALEELGFEIDLSIIPQMDFSGECGPSFAAFDASPFLFGRTRPLLEVPCTTGYIGLAKRAGSQVHPIADSRALRPMRLVGVMAKLGILNKVVLSPEASTLDEMKALVRSSVARGLRVFSLTLHSPSADVGCTPYVRSHADLERFLARTEAFCEFFMGEMAGTTMALDAFRQSVTAGQPLN
jgi:hypothetical protein